MHPMFRILVAATSLSFGGVVSPLTAGTDSTATPILAASAGPDRVTLKWSLCPSCDSYEVFRSAASAGPWTSIAKVRQAVTHADTGLASRTLYFYRVSGFRGAVEGDFSDVLQAITSDSIVDSTRTKQKPTHP